MAGAGAVVASSTVSRAAYAVEEGVIGDWSADGSSEVEVPPSPKGNASASDGTYREHNAATFPANDASPID